MVEIKPPEPTAEEIAAREEAAKAAAAAQKGKKGAAPVEVIEEKEPEVTYEEAPPSFLDLIFKDEDVGEATKGPCSTVTLKNGLIVRHMPNGDVVQIKDQSLTDPTAKTEIDRVYVKGGVIIRHFHNLDCEVLCPNGDYAFFERANLKWTITNDKGFKREYQDGKSKDLPKINCLVQTDKESGIVTKVREDNVVMIKYEDGHLYCQHADGTRIFSQENGNQIRIEKEGFAPVMYQFTEKGESLAEWLETDELRSTDRVETLVFLPDKCTVKTIKFFKSSEETDRHVFKHIYQRDDYSCFMIDSDGDFRVISTEARVAINEDQEKERLGHDVEYLKQMYQPEGKYNPGVYYGRICDEPSKVHITCKDSESPFIYRLDGNLKLHKLTDPEFEPNSDWAPTDQRQDFELERDIEYIGQGRNPYSRSYIFPRMFIVNPSGDAMELLSQDQIDQILKFNQTKEESLTTSRIEYIDNTQMNSI